MGTRRTAKGGLLFLEDITQCRDIRKYNHRYSILWGIGVGARGERKNALGIYYINDLYVDRVRNDRIPATSVERYLVVEARMRLYLFLNCMLKVHCTTNTAVEP